MAADPISGAGSTFPGGESWFNSTSIVQLQAFPNQGFMFDHWSCTGTRCFSGSQNPIPITLNGPMVMTAHFLQVAGVVVQSLNGNGFMIVDNSNPVQLNASSPYIPDWRINSTHTIQALSNASCGFDLGPFHGCVYQFQEWLVNGTTPISGASGDTYSFTVNGKPITIIAVYRQNYTNVEMAIVVIMGIVAATLYLRPKKRSHRSSRKVRLVGSETQKPVQKWCANCGAINPHDNAFCGKCGFNLDATRVYE